MAKKKTEEATLPGLPEQPKAEPVQTAPAEGEKVSKMEAVRRALAEGISGPTEIVEYLKRRFGLELNEQTASSYKSQIKAKEKGEGGLPSSNGRKTSSQPASSGPTLADLFKVKEMLAAKDSPEAFIRHVEEVEEMAEAVGGLDRLKACLDALAKLQG